MSRWRLERQGKAIDQWWVLRANGIHDYSFQLHNVTFLDGVNLYQFSEIRSALIVYPDIDAT